MHSHLPGRRRSRISQANQRAGSGHCDWRENSARSAPPHLLVRQILGLFHCLRESLRGGFVAETIGEIFFLRQIAPEVLV